MASGYHIAVKLYQHHVLERVSMPWIGAVDVINVLDVFAAVTLLFLNQLLVNHSSVALP